MIYTKIIFLGFFQWWGMIFIFTNPYCDRKHTNEIYLKVCLNIIHKIKIWWKFMLILEICILIIIFYCIIMKFMQRQKKFRNILPVTFATARTMFLVCPFSPSATGTCEQRLRFHQNRSAAEPWLLWTGAEISSSSSEKKFDMTFLEVLELQLFSICNKHTEIWCCGKMGLWGKAWLSALNMCVELENKGLKMWEKLPKHPGEWQLTVFNREEWNHRSVPWKEEFDKWCI